MTTPTGLVPIEVPAPTLTPHRYGLLNAAQVINDTGPAGPDSLPRWAATGVIYGSVCAQSSGLWLDPCVFPPVPVPVAAYVVTFTKPAGVDTVTATLTSRHPGYADTPVSVTVDATTLPLATVGATQTFDVTASSTVNAEASIAADGVYPACDSATVALDIPATGAAMTPVPVSCQATPSEADPDPKTFTAGMAQVAGLPFTVTDTAECYVQGGRTEAELRAIAEQRLTLHEQGQVERRFWTVELGIDQAQVLPPPSGAAWSLCQAVGELERVLATLSGAPGVLHAPRQVGAPAYSLRLFDKQGGQALSPLDNQWAFGGGYLNTNAAGDPAPPGQAWIYATGPVVIRRTPVITASVLDHSGNRWRVLSERYYVATADCPVVAALVDLPEC